MSDATRSPSANVGKNRRKDQGQEVRGEAWLAALVTPLKDRLSGRTLARALNVSPSTITRWMDLGRIEFIQLGRKRYLTKTSVQKFFEQNRQQPTV